MLDQICQIQGVAHSWNLFNSGIGPVPELCQSMVLHNQRIGPIHGLGQSLNWYNSAIVRVWLILGFAKSPSWPNSGTGPEGCDQVCDQEHQVGARRPQPRNACSWPQPRNAQLAGQASESMYAHENAMRIKRSSR